MKLSVILTVYNREPLVLFNTLLQLSKNNLRDTEIIIIDDGSDEDYSGLLEMLPELPIKWERIVTLEDRPDTYNIDGHNNPAYVNNRAIEMAQGETLLFLSSDTLVPPHALATVKRHAFKHGVIAARTINLDNAALFCGPEKVWPMCWFIAAPKEQVVKCGSFDEQYLKGMAFEDNDFTARLVLENGSLLITGRITCWHQTHPETAYTDDWKGFKVSEAYTKEKWGGVPWRPGEDGECFEYEVLQRAEDTVQVVPKLAQAVVDFGTEHDIRQGAGTLG